MFVVIHLSRHKRVFNYDNPQVIPALQTRYFLMRTFKIKIFLHNSPFPGSYFFYIFLSLYYFFCAFSANTKIVVMPFIACCARLHGTTGGQPTHRIVVFNLNYQFPKKRIQQNFKKGIFSSGKDNTTSRSF